MAAAAAAHETCDNSYHTGTPAIGTCDSSSSTWAQLADQKKTTKHKTQKENDEEFEIRVRPALATGMVHILVYAHQKCTCSHIYRAARSCGTRTRTCKFIQYVTLLGGRAHPASMPVPAKGSKQCVIFIVTAVGYAIQDHNQA